MDHYEDEGGNDEKSQTFRKRRLSLSNHGSSQLQSGGAAVASAEGSPSSSTDHSPPPPMDGRPSDSSNSHNISDADPGSSSEDATGLGGCGAAVPSTSGETEGASDAESKAHTFRKRRLSLTNRVADSGGGDDAGSHTSGGRGSGTGNRQYNNPLKRRLSEASGTSSIHSNGQTNTVHAGELFCHDNGPPPSPALHDSVLYRYYGLPSSASGSVPPLTSVLLPPAVGGTAAAVPQQPVVQPKWKRRHVVREQSKLPFPPDAVGIFSCHGMEPVYDSDYEEEEEEDNDPLEHNALQRTVAVAVAEDGQPQDGDGDDRGRSSDLPESDPSGGATSPSGDGTGAALLHVDRAPTHAAGVGGGAPDPTTLPGLQYPPQQRTVAKINQDRGGVAYPYANNPRTALFAVYDGHGQGGELVSQFALHEVQRRLEKHPEFPSEIAFVDTFRAVDEALKHEPLIEPLYAGTTACVVLLQDHTLTIANVGDSRAVLGRRRPRKNAAALWGAATTTSGKPTIASDFLALPLTEDQNPDLPDEFARISNSGGYVTASPGPGLSARVWLDATCTQIGLAMARSIGDHSVSAVGVIADPVITTYQIDSQDDFLVLASDGVWEFLESQEAVDIVAQNLDRGATKACQALIEAAAARWHDEEGEYRDDITAIVVRLQLLWKSDGTDFAGTAAAASKDAASNATNPND